MSKSHEELLEMHQRFVAPMRFIAARCHEMAWTIKDTDRTNE